MRTWVLGHFVAEFATILVMRLFDRFGWFEPHVVPAKVLETIGALAEALWPHGRTSGTLARKKTRRERGERLGFAGHLPASLLADDATAETANGTRTGRCNPGGCTRS